ncbi:rab family, other [Mucor circinelloides 1006PhL]|uniref:Rab family, other n=1 Tax=Mucor circinelloides f. circinelloides (strain 1006PhL) TaxID=1220926 RepID=S2J148_MUCC1|nr:rab family, other [Mucor circinelloides 1006PhL]
MSAQIPSVKLVLLGESSVGKSSIVTRYATDTFVEGRDATIGAAFLTKVCSTDDREVKFEIWDTAGQERFHSLAPMYYRNALAAIVVFDVTKYSSFTRAQTWVQELQRQANPHLTIAFVGNKIDTEKRYRDVSTEEADLYAKEFNLLYFETSARVGTNVHHVFTEIAKHIPLEQAQMSSSTASGKRTMNLKEQQNSDRMNSCAC